MGWGPTKLISEVGRMGPSWPPAQRIGSIQDPHLHPHLGSGFQAGHHGAEKGVHPATHVQQVHQQNIQPLLTWPGWEPWSRHTKNKWGFQAGMDSVVGLHHVVLLFSEKNHVGARDGLQSAWKGPGHGFRRRGHVGKQAGRIAQKTHARPLEGRRRLGAEHVQAACGLALSEAFG